MAINSNYTREGSGWSLRKERQAVSQGAKLLDKLLPGWHKKINLQKLQMHNATLCMMGQLFGDGVEGKLAEKMYPEEMAEARKHENMGWRRAMGGIAYGERWGCNLVKKLLTKINLSAKTAHYRALVHVCRGHDNRCLWAEEIAERKVRSGKKVA